MGVNELIVAIDKALNLGRVWWESTMRVARSGASTLDGIIGSEHDVESGVQRRNIRSSANGDGSREATMTAT